MKGTPREEIKKQIDKAISKSYKKEIIKFAGKLKTDIDPLEYQRQPRVVISLVAFAVGCVWAHVWKIYSSKECGK